MKTADLIKKREEENNNSESSWKSSTTMGDGDQSVNSPDSTTSSTDSGSGNPYEGKSMEEARMLGAIPEAERENAVSLYNDGVNSGNKTTVEGSPINTQEYANFREKVFGPEDFGVETEEQKKKRERADFIKQGLTGLTEGLSSLANLYYTTKWAPNQKLTSQMPALQQQLYRERLERDKKLEQFRAWQRAKAEKDADRAYQEKIFNINRNDRLAREEADAKQRQENFKVQFDYKVGRDKLADERYKEETEYRRGQDAEKNRQFWATHNRLSNKNSSSSSSSGSGKSSKMAVINTPKGVMDVDYGRINEATFNQMYQRVDDTTKELFKIDNNIDDEKSRTQKMNQAIAYALENQEGYSDWLEKAGVGTYQQQQPSQESKKQEQKGDSEDKYIDFARQRRPRKQEAGTKAPEAVKVDNPKVEATENQTEPKDTQSSNVVNDTTALKDIIANHRETKAKDLAARQKARDEENSAIKRKREELSAKAIELQKQINERFPEINLKDLGELSREEQNIVASIRSRDSMEKAKMLSELDTIYREMAELKALPTITE